MLLRSKASLVHLLVSTFFVCFLFLLSICLYNLQLGDEKLEATFHLVRVRSDSFHYTEARQAYFTSKEVQTICRRKYMRKRVSEEARHTPVCCHVRARRQPRSCCASAALCCPALTACRVTRAPSPPVSTLTRRTSASRCHECHLNHTTRTAAPGDCPPLPLQRPITEVDKKL